MATADVTHHATITLSSGTVYGLTLDERDPWRELDTNSFAPQVSAGAKGYGDLSLFSVVAQEDWRHGFGFVYQSDEMGYCYSGDHIDARFSGFVQLATALTSTDACGHQARAFRDFGSTPAVYAGYTSGGLRLRASDTSWSDITNASPVMSNSDTIYDLIDTGDYLVASRSGASKQVLKSATGATDSWSAAGSAVSGHETYSFHHLALGGGRVWGSEDAKNLVHYCSATDLSDWEGQGTADANLITVGPGTIPIQKMVWFQNNMNVGRTDGLWIIGDDDTARQVLSFYDSKASNNFDGMCVGPDDRLYFPIRDKVYRWTGRNLEDITPGNWGQLGRGYKIVPVDTFGPKPLPPNYASGERPPYTFYILFHSMFTDGINVYVVGRTSATSYQEDLLCWTGSGWHKLYELVPSGTYVTYAGYYSPGVARMLISVSGTTTTTYMVKRNSGSPLPYDAYPITGNHYLYSSKINLGLLEIDKCFDALD